MTARCPTCKKFIQGPYSEKCSSCYSDREHAKRRRREVDRLVEKALEGWDPFERFKGRV